MQDVARWQNLTPQLMQHDTSNWYSCSQSHLKIFINFRPPMHYRHTFSSIIGLFIASTKCYRNEKMKRRRRTFLPSSSAIRPACALRITPMHRSSMSLISVKPILEFWACLDIFYFTNLVFQSSLRSACGLVWRGWTWETFFSFVKKCYDESITVVTL